MIQTPIKVSLLAKGLLYQQYYPNIHAFSLADSSNEIMDIIYERVIEIDQQSAQEQCHVGYMGVLDGVSYTPYMLHIVQKAIAQTPKNSAGSTAIVSDTFLNSVLSRLALPHIVDKPHRATRLFTTELEALQWLRQRNEQFS